MSADPSTQRVVVADDDVLLREGIAGLLQRAGYEFAGQRATPPTCCAWFATSTPTS